jgi:hypothetical protein
VERSPRDLFTEFCADQQVQDDRVTALFNRLHDHLTSGTGD